jgi:rubredoxin
MNINHVVSDATNAFVADVERTISNISDQEARDYAAHAIQAVRRLEGDILARLARQPQAASLPLILHCPLCHARHIDEGEFATKAHHTHACQSCGHVWRPAIAATVGVQFLPGFKNP